MASTVPVMSELERLPRGRHGLSREEVESRQRTRILAATVDVVAELGYPETRVVDIIQRAGVSRKTFYELFDDKEDCFLAAFDVAAGALAKVTNDGYEAEPEEPWAERVCLGLANFLRIIADRPTAAKFCIVDVLAAGERALARRDAVMRQFTEYIERGRAETTVQLPPMTALALVGGVYELLYSEILHGATANLPARLPDVLYWVVHPFLGDERAEAAREQAREVTGPPAGTYAARAREPSAAGGGAEEAADSPEAA
jgi:AcrR family transcriptional regulator